jgi:hypothetical protein
MILPFFKILHHSISGLTQQVDKPPNKIRAEIAKTQTQNELPVVPVIEAVKKPFRFSALECLFYRRKEAFKKKAS